MLVLEAEVLEDILLEVEILELEILLLELCLLDTAVVTGAGLGAGLVVITGGGATGFAGTASVNSQSPVRTPPPSGQWPIKNPNRPSVRSSPPYGQPGHYKHN